MWKKTKLMGTSRQPFPVKIMNEQKKKKQENVESFSYLGNMLTNNGRCTCEIKSGIAMVKAAFNKNVELKIEEEAIKMLHVEHSFIWC
jgi:hypothetical protein